MGGVGGQSSGKERVPYAPEQGRGGMGRVGRACGGAVFGWGIGWGNNSKMCMV